jgi:antitoxin (DNA-binding transcriptional repressor) of toxin-antitoxin stability system
METSIVDMRYKMKQVIEAVDRGEEVTVLYHGKARARVVPPRGAGEPRPHVKDDPAFGMWADRKEMKDVDAYVRAMRRERYRDL